MLSVLSLARCGAWTGTLAALFLGGSRAEAQADSLAALARSRYREAVAARGRGELVAARGLVQAHQAWPVQPAYLIAAAELSARTGDTSGSAHWLDELAGERKPGATADPLLGADRAAVVRTAVRPCPAAGHRLPSSDRDRFPPTALPQPVSTSVECVVQAEYLLGECPVWCQVRERLYWVDSRGPAVHWRVEDGTVGSLAVPSVIGSLGLRNGDGVIAALKDGLYFLDLEAGGLEPIARPEEDQPENRFNDGRVDRQGRFWAGTMNDARRDPTGTLYRLDPDLRVTPVISDIIVPNSLAWSPESRVMYFADTYRHVIWTFDFDAETGAPDNRRVFADLSGGPGRPDGSTVDADGCLWNAEYAGARVVRYRPDGKVDRVVSMPVSNPTSCCFGGARLDTLFITSARQRLRPEQLAKEPLAGSVFAVVPGVQGLPEPRFGVRVARRQ